MVFNYALSTSHGVHICVHRMPVTLVTPPARTAFAARGDSGTTALGPSVALGGGSCSVASGR
eukprot:184187-Chlamydomonas_euryale.AAC.1